jgi:hypothetical protein
MKSLPGASPVIANHEEDSFANAGRLANLARTVHPLVHTGIDFSCHAFGLSASFYNTGKHPVAGGPAVKVFNYLRQFEMRCACACGCGYTRNRCVQGNREGSCGAENRNTGTCAGRADVNRRNGSRRRNCCRACERGGPVPDACSGNRSCDRFPGDVLVTLKNGKKTPVKDLKPTDIFKTYNGCSRIALILRNIMNKEIYKIEFTNGAFPRIAGCAAGIENGRGAANNRIIRPARPAFRAGEGEMLRASPAEQKERIPSLFHKQNPKFQEYALAVAGQLIKPQNSRKNGMFYFSAF